MTGTRRTTVAERTGSPLDFRSGIRVDGLEATDPDGFNAAMDEDGLVILVSMSLAGKDRAGDRIEVKVFERISEHDFSSFILFPIPSS